MRILVVISVYPPQHVGGYDLGCRDVVDNLRARNHEVQVLTSTFRNDSTESPKDEAHIERTLQFNYRSTDHAHNKIIECYKLISALLRFSPDVVYFWSISGLSYWLPFAAMIMRAKVAFFLSDTTFLSWRVGAWLKYVDQMHSGLGRLVRRKYAHTWLLKGRAVIEGQACHFASHFLRGLAKQGGIRVKEGASIVAHWGISSMWFSCSSRKRWPIRRLLYVGQMIVQKGVHTAISAFALLAEKPGFEHLKLTLVGGGLSQDYENRLHKMVNDKNISERVIFLGKIPREELPSVYSEHDVLLFPSEWEEPFAITPLEAIASGLVVVGTATGGSGELFHNHETAMTFTTGDSADCARAVTELIKSESAFTQIQSKALHHVQSNNKISDMIHKLEAALLALSEEQREL